MHRCVLSIVLAIVLFSGVQWARSAVIMSLNAATGVLESDLSTAEDGDGVEKWVDQSGFGNDAAFSFSPSISSTRPLFSTTAHLGGPALGFSGGNNDSRLQAASSVLTNSTYFKISTTVRINDRGDGVLNGLERPFAMTYGVGNPLGWEFMSFTRRAQFYVGPGDGGTDRLSSGATLLSVDTWYDISVERIGGQFSLYVNNSLVDQKTFTRNFGSARNLTLGNGSDYNFAQLYGNIASFSIEVPEPAGAGLLALAVGGMTLVRRRR